MPVNLASPALRDDVADDSPSAQWLATITRHVLEEGFVDLSLRQMAALAGTSHRMLTYYFGSRDGLLGAVLRRLRAAESGRLMGESRTRREGMERAWAYYTAPARDLEMRIFYYLAGQAARSPAGHQAFMDAIVSTWVEACADLGIAEGLDPDRARIEARLLTSAARGLLLDRLMTGEGADVDRAYTLMLDSVLGPDSDG